MTTLQRIIKYCAMGFAIFLVISIVGGICGALGIVSYVFQGDSTGEMQAYSVSKEVKSLDVEISAADFQIVSGDGFAVESDHKNLNVKEEGGTLYISEEKKMFGWFFEGAKLVLTIPQEFQFDEAIISTGAGKVDIEALSSDKLSLELGAGAVEIGSLKAKNQASVESGAGKLTIEDGELHNLSMEVGVGKLELKGKLTGDCTMDYGIGEAEVTLVGEEKDYQIQLDKGLGEATLAGKSMSDESLYGDGDNKIKIDGGVGAVHIDFDGDSSIQEQME